MEINCGKIAENYLLIKNPIYSFSFPISILVAIIVFGFAKAYKWSNNSYVNQILIPVLALLLTMVLLDIISRLMISKDEKMKGCIMEFVKDDEV
jgi:phosphate/sulfate permease